VRNGDLMKGSKVTPIRGVKIQFYFRGRPLRPRTFFKASLAAKAWSARVALNIALNCPNLTYNNTTSLVQFCSDSTEYQSAYKRAYRRSLKIFKKILP
jgi:hypothetical protein